ncbi:hypothetical protein [Kitasatospora sp. NPDC093806]|uniref:hypothetical protein n=1 Tax=Kitasatospora sp. NPDC093806 TaxID=3155075 RepID=UPI003417C8FD
MLVHLDLHRVLNPAFAAAETVWILSGSSADRIHDFDSRLAALTDHGTLQSSYGRRCGAGMGGWANSIASEAS